MLSIVIPTYNQWTRLEAVLHALALQAEATKTRVIVVNDGSTDSTAQSLDLLSWEWLSIIHQANGGRSAARNAGLKLVETPIVLFLDDDMVVEPEFIANHLCAQQERPGVYVGEIFNIPENRVPQFFAGRAQGRSAAELKQLEAVDVLVNLARYFHNSFQAVSEADAHIHSEISWVCMVAANVSFPISLLKKAGGFDPAFQGWGVEDHELAYRFHREGALFRHVPAAKAFHLDHRKPIDRMLLLENVLYFYKKSGYDPQVKAYVDFVTGKSSLRELFECVMDMRLSIEQPDIFFQPNRHLDNKSSEVTVHGRNH